jgi:glycosyltransferase involved in cell wall biosynthesis
MNRDPRVALFADTFHEVNGAALTCRQLDTFARRNGLDFLSVRCGPEEYFERIHHCWTLQLKRGSFAFHVDRDLSFDLLLFRRRRKVLNALREFRPDIVHVTSPGDLGIMGAWAAHALKVPLVAAWHTNLHEFAARRIERSLDALPRSWRKRVAAFAEHWILDRVLWFYGLARVTLAPNEELARLIGERTRKPVFLMSRGIDTEAFSPAHRTRGDGPLVIGFVGRVTPEKNVRFLARLEKALLATGAPPFELLVVGDGSERMWLEANLRRGRFTGVQTGMDLSRAYANMDLFAFPSHTDTYGNVVLEAMASGVPAVVTADGGPKYLVRHGESGFVAATDDEFIECVRRLVADAESLGRMRRAAREHARHFSWDRVFESEVYAAYRVCLANPAGDSAAIAAEAGRPADSGNRSLATP